MTAQFEEMIVAANPFHLQQLRPQAGQGLFDLSLRRLVGFARVVLGVRRGQRLAVHLAVERQGESRQYHERAGHHVFGQGRGQLLPQSGHGQRDLRLRHDIGDQALLARLVGPHHHHGVLHALAGDEPGFDFTQFDTETADLHLVVVASQAFQAAFRQPTAQVPRAVQQGTGFVAERVGYELLRGQVGTIQVPLRHAFAADVDLADDTQGRQLLARIEHIHLGIGNRSANRHALRVFGHRLHFQRGGIGSGFGRPIAMHQTQRRCQAQQAPEGRHVGPFATAQQDAQARHGLGDQLHVLVEDRRGHEQHGGPRRVQHLGKARRLEQGFMVDHHHLSAVEQRAPDVHGAGVERRVGGKGDPVVLIEIGIAVVDHQPIDCPVRHQHALGLSRGTRGVHDVGNRLARLFQPWIVDGPLRLQRVQVDAARALGYLLAAGRQHERRPAIGEHEPLPLKRSIAVQRDIGRRALENGQLAGQQVDRTRQQDRHTIVRLHAKTDQVMGQAVRLCVQFAIRHLPLAMHHRNCLRPSCRLGLEQRQHGLVLRIDAPGSVEVHQQLLALDLREDIQTVEWGLRILLQRLHQVIECRVHVRADAACANALQHQGAQGEAIAQVVHRQRQRIVRAFFAVQGRHALPGRRRLRRDDAGGTVPIVQQGTEQRRRSRHAAATLGQGQRRVFMSKQCTQPPMDGLDAGLHALLIQHHPQWQGVDEHAQGPVGAFAALHPPHQHGAEHHIVAPGQPPQHLRPGQMMKAGSAHAHPPRLGPQAATQVGIHLEPCLFDTATVTLHLLQTERQRRLIDIAKHFAEKDFVLFFADTQARLGHIVAVRHRSRQLLLPSKQVHLHFLLHHVQRGMVQGNVVEQQHRHPALVERVMGKSQAHQRGLADIEAMMTGIET